MVNEFSADLNRLTQSDVARLLNVSVRHVAELTSAGVLPCTREGRRVYYAWTAVLSGFLQRTVHKGGVSEALAKKYAVETARAELKLGVERGALCSRDELIALFHETLRSITHHLLELKGKWAIPMSATTTPAAAAALINKEVRVLLANMQLDYNRIFAKHGPELYGVTKAAVDELIAKRITSNEENEKHAGPQTSTTRQAGS